MALICSISGVEPEEPCLSKTGYVFERRLIEKHLEESQTCPVTGEQLTVADLTPIKCRFDYGLERSLFPCLPDLDMSDTPLSCFRQQARQTQTCNGYEHSRTSITIPE